MKQNVLVNTAWGLSSYQYVSKSSEIQQDLYEKKNNLYFFTTSQVSDCLYMFNVNKMDCSVCLNSSERVRGTLYTKIERVKNCSDIKLFGHFVFMQMSTLCDSGPHKLIEKE